MTDKLKQARKQQKPGKPITAKVVTLQAPAETPGRHWSEWLTGAIALLALAVSLVAYLDTRDVNHITEDRYEQRYADRVVWWISKVDDNEYGGVRITIKVQNRALMPIRNIQFGYDRPPLGPATEAFSNSSLPPCSIGDFYLEFGSEVTGIRLGFADGDGRTWSRDHNGLLAKGDSLFPFQPTSLSSVLIGAGAQAKYAAAEDCTDS